MQNVLMNNMSAGSHFTQGAQWFFSFHQFQRVQGVLGLTLQRNQQVKQTLS